MLTTLSTLTTFHILPTLLTLPTLPPLPSLTILTTLTLPTTSQSYRGTVIYLVQMPLDYYLNLHPSKYSARWS